MLEARTNPARLILRKAASDQAWELIGRFDQVGDLADNLAALGQLAAADFRENG